MSDSLLSLQDHDTAIAELQRKLGSLPERAAAHELNERRHTTEAAIAALGPQLDQLAAAEVEVETALATVEKRAAALDETLRSPGSATRDAQAIIHEIDQLRAQAATLEESGLELLEQRDALLVQQAEGQAALDAVAQDAPGVLAALTAAEGDAGRELAELEAKRREVAATVPPDLLATYERLRAQLGGTAVARVQSGACTGCHLSLASADLDQFTKLAPGQHATCEQCGRILIRE
ncbi:MAG: uncharacterized protein QOI61_2502 [Actinomycetota bacterium]